MTETATYNKLYIRILCLIVSHFHFELKDLESWGSAIDEKMQLTVQDSMSARALRQLNFIKNRNQLTAPQKATVVEENKEEMEEDKKEEMLKSSRKWSREWRRRRATRWLRNRSRSRRRTARRFSVSS